MLRASIFSVLCCVVVLGVPASVIGYLVRADPARLQPSEDRLWLFQAGAGPWGYVALLAVLSATAAVLAIAVAMRYARRVTAPLQQLVIQAEKLGAGDARSERVESGIEEIDKVSSVLTSSATQLVTSLSSERDFASDASHQLRTPLTALLMRLEEIAIIDDIEAVHEEATIAIEQVERLNDTVDALLARARQGKKSAATDAVSLDSVIAAMQREWHPAFMNERRSIHVTGERGLRVVTTSVALAQVLSTLVENSLAHGQGTLKIEARRSGPSVVLEVSDEGPGIDPGLAPHIFERSVSTKSTGLGLGLARDVAEAHGGRLELVSGQPAVFALFLSAAD